jgi:DNA-binding transcriptional regulator YiaG
MMGSEFRKIRQGWDATLTDVARAFGVAVSTVSSWETGRNRIPPDIDLGLVRDKIEALVAGRKLRIARRREAQTRSSRERRRRNQVDGEAFRHARLALGVSQHTVARVLGVSQRTVHDWEKGRSPVPASLDLSSLRKPLQADAAAAKDRVKRAAAAGRRRWRDQLTPEERGAYLGLLSRRNREVWSERSKGEIARMVAPLHEGARRWRMQLTAQEHAAFMVPLQEGARRWWASLTPEERSEWRREQFWHWFRDSIWKASARFLRRSHIGNGVSGGPREGRPTAAGDDGL